MASLEINLSPLLVLLPHHLHTRCSENHLQKPVKKPSQSLSLNRQDESQRHRFPSLYARYLGLHAGGRSIADRVRRMRASRRSLVCYHSQDPIIHGTASYLNITGTARVQPQPPHLLSRPPLPELRKPAQAPPNPLAVKPTATTTTARDLASPVPPEHRQSLTTTSTKRAKPSTTARKPRVQQALLFPPPRRKEKSTRTERSTTTRRVRAPQAPAPPNQSAASFTVTTMTAKDLVLLSLLLSPAPLHRRLIPVERSLPLLCSLPSLLPSRALLLD